MFPSRGDLHVAPFQDEALYMEQINKVNFWYQDYFHGVNLSSLRDAAMKEYFRQPIVSWISLNDKDKKKHLLLQGSCRYTIYHFRIFQPFIFSVHP